MNKLFQGVFSLALIIWFMSSAFAVAPSIRPDEPVADQLLKCDTSKLTYKTAWTLPTYNYSELVKAGSSENRVWASKDWPKNTQEVNDLLTGLTSVATIDSFEGSSNVRFPLLNFLVNGKNIRYTLDFMKYRNEPDLVNNSNVPKRYLRVGVGLRLQISIKSYNGELGTNLMALAQEVKANKTEGTIHTEVIGISSSELTAAIPIDTDLSVGSIQNIVQTFGIVRAKLSDPNTKLAPHVLGVVECLP